MFFIYIRATAHQLVEKSELSIHRYMYLWLVYLGNYH